ncbi:MAG: radical SAM protein [Elusimicrobia bacterium]|nr:radical SAM protein [Elusimicrobiota bacterium]
MKIDFKQAPLFTIWETTRACPLACSHCRAETLASRDDGELSTEEGKRLLTDVASMDGPIVILSGGDCLNRPDLAELIQHGKHLGLRMYAWPAATPSVTPERVAQLEEAGIDGMSFGIDGPDASTHDGFRKSEGSFDLSLKGIETVRAAGVRAAVRTCVAEWNFGHIERMISLVGTLGLSCWELHFLIPAGRVRGLRGISAQDFEDVFERLHGLSLSAPYDVKVSEAPHYNRFVLEKAAQGFPTKKSTAGCGGGEAPEKAVNAGNGCIYIDHVGNICPSPWLPLAAGNVRTHPLAETYRDAHPFRELKDTKLLKGRCGACEYNGVCGGSRARAWAVTGDFLETDPYCAYIPKAMRVASQTAP